MSPETPGIQSRTFLKYSSLIPILALLFYVLYQRFLSPLSRIPGPFLASLSRWWLVYQTRTGHFNHYIQALHAKYGPVVRIAPDELSLADSSSVRQVYGPGNKFQKSNWYGVIRGNRKFDLLGVQDEKLHGQQRKMVARAYTMETLKDLEPYVDKCIEILRRKMDERVGRSVDMTKWMQLFAIDVMGEITWSASLGFLEAAQDDGTLATNGAIISSAIWLGHVPYIFALHEYLKPYIGNWLGVNKRHGGLRDFALRETAKRKENPGGKLDIINRLFNTHEKSPEHFTYVDVISMATSNINAGSDTTAASMGAILENLLRNPSSKAKLLEEIDDARRKGELSNPVKFSEAMKLKYLQATIYEALRLHPAIGFNLPRVVPQGGMEHLGYYIPGGNVVGVNAWVINMNKDVYGEDTRVFRPERWLEGDSGDMLRCFFSFGAGSRACIGRNISWLQMSKMIPTLFLNYHMELTNPSKQCGENFRGFVLQTDFNVTLTPRVDPADWQA